MKLWNFVLLAGMVLTVLNTAARAALPDLSLEQAQCSQFVQQSKALVQSHPSFRDENSAAFMRLLEDYPGISRQLRTVIERARDGKADYDEVMEALAFYPCAPLAYWDATQELVRGGAKWDLDIDQMQAVGTAYARQMKRDLRAPVTLLWLLIESSAVQELSDAGYLKLLPGQRLEAEQVKREAELLRKQLRADYDQTALGAQTASSPLETQARSRTLAAFRKELREAQPLAERLRKLLPR